MTTADLDKAFEFENDRKGIRFCVEISTARAVAAFPAKYPPEKVAVAHEIIRAAASKDVTTLARMTI